MRNRRGGPGEVLRFPADEQRSPADVLPASYAVIFRFRNLPQPARELARGPVRRRHGKENLAVE